MRSFLNDYTLVSAADLTTALAFLANGEGWRPLAGGTDIMVLFNAGKLPFRQLVNIREIPEIQGISATSTHVIIGATVTYAEIRRSELLRSQFPLLCTAASWTGGAANQNRGTLGGNIVNASPAADSPPALLVYDAEVRLASIRGDRWLPYAGFHIGYKKMQIAPDELLTHIRLPRNKNGWRVYGRKVAGRRAQAISKICVAGAIEMNGAVIQDIRLSFGSVAPIPLRCVKTEELLRGETLSAEVLATAQRRLLEEIAPISDIRSTGEYRARVCVNLLGEFLDEVNHGEVNS